MSAQKRHPALFKAISVLGTEDRLTVLDFLESKVGDVLAAFPKSRGQYLEVREELQGRLAVEQMAVAA